MLKIGTQGISGLYLGGQKITKAYLGQELVFNSTSPIPVYTITAAIDPAGSGTVTGTGQYQEGETVTLTATVADGYKFTGWQENGQTVSESETYAFTAMGDRVLVAVFEAEASRLPAGYTEVEYIQSTSSGGQTIDTGVIPSATLKATIDHEPLETPTAANARYIFYRNYTASSYTYVWTAYWNNAGIKASIGRSAGSVTYKTVSSDKTARRVVLTMDSSTKTASINGGAPVDILLGTASYAGSTPIRLLGSATSSTLPTKIYSCQMENSNGLVRDFVPCVDPSGVAGLYDLVNGKFYQSGSSTPFTAGPAV